VGVLFGAFQTRREANEAMGDLPGNLRQFGPTSDPWKTCENDLRPPAGNVTSRASRASSVFREGGRPGFRLRFALKKL